MSKKHKKSRNLVQIPIELIHQFVMEVNPGAESYVSAKELFIRSLKLKNARAITIKWYIYTLDKFYEYLIEYKLPTSPFKIKRKHIENYLLYSFEQLKNKPETINNKLRGIRPFFNFLFGEGYITNNPVELVNKFEQIDKIKPKFTPEHLKALFSQPNLKTFTGLRDYIIMLLMLDTAARISEVLSIKIEDIKYSDGLPSGIVIRHPKGKRQRIVPLSSKMQTALENYLQVRNINYNGFTATFLFPSIYGEKLSSRTIQGRIKKYGNKAGIDDVRVSPHTFRHTFAAAWVSAGGDIFSLQEILGHTTLDVVKIYAQQNDKDIKKKHNQFSPLNTQF